jgi:hypothetical protein
MRRALVLSVTLVAAALITVGAASAKPAALKTYTVNLKGSVEVPPGSPTGTGVFRFTLDTSKGQICWGLTWSGIGSPTAAHIHKGGKGKAGPVLIGLFFQPPAKHSGCTSAPKSQVSAIKKHLSSYYVNVHTQKYPAGAIRSQL